MSWYTPQSHYSTAAATTSNQFQVNYNYVSSGTSTLDNTWYVGESNATTTVSGTSSTYPNTILPQDISWIWCDEVRGYEWTGIHDGSLLKRYKKEQRQIKRAQKKADRLLKNWLSETEYNYLKENDELEIPSKLEDETIYIVKKDPSRKVLKKVKGVATEELCIVPLDDSFCKEDVLLSKVLLLKSDEQSFNNIARKYPLSIPLVPMTQ